MKRLALLITFGLMGSSSLIAGNKVNDRVVHAAIVLKEVTQISEKSIPQDLLDKSACVAVFPGTKRAGFIFGGSYGKGVMSCRTQNGDGPWSAPTMFLLQGGSFGLQIGVQSVDLVLVIMNLSGFESLLNSKFSLGGDVSVAAGPVGRTAAAQTDAFMSAEILAYSRSRGLFGGLVLKGESIRPDRDANHVLYGKQVEPRSVLLNQADSIPKDAKIFLDELTRISPKKKAK